MVIHNEFELGDIVYIKNDPDQLERMVIEIKVLFNNMIMYLLAQNTSTSNHYAQELSKIKDLKFL